MEVETGPFGRNYGGSFTFRERGKSRVAVGTDRARRKEEEQESDDGMFSKLSAQVHARLLPAVAARLRLRVSEANDGRPLRGSP